MLECAGRGNIKTWTKEGGWNPQRKLMAGEGVIMDADGGKIGSPAAKLGNRSASGL